MDRRRTGAAAVILPTLLSGILMKLACAEEVTPPRKAATAGVPMDVSRDLRYGDDPTLNSLDLYAPRDKGKRPVVIFIHGGAWSIGDKRNIGSKADSFVRAGYVYATVNYRLSPSVKHPVHVQDVAKAIAWIHANVQRYGGDPDRIFVIGHSAGAHLAVLVGTDERYVQAEGMSLRDLSGVVPLDGAGYDIPRQMAGNESRIRRLYETPFGSDAALWRDASPITHVAKGKGIPPFLIIHAGLWPASRLQTEWLAEALRRAGVSVEVFHAADKNHMTLNRDLGRPGDEPTRRILEFMGRCSGPVASRRATESKG